MRQWHNSYDSFYYCWHILLRKHWASAWQCNSQGTWQGSYMAAGLTLCSADPSAQGRNTEEKMRTGAAICRAKWHRVLGEVLMPHNIYLDCFSILLASRNHSTNYIRIDDVKNLLHTIRAKMNILLISRACQQQCVGQWTGWPHGGEREPSMISSGIHWSRKTVCSVICSTFRIQWTPSWLHSREEHTTTLLCNGVPLTLNITTFFRPTNSVIQRAWQISLLHLQIQPLFCFSGQICESIRYHLTECPVA